MNTVPVVFSHGIATFVRGWAVVESQHSYAATGGQARQTFCFSQLNSNTLVPGPLVAVVVVIPGPPRRTPIERGRHP